MKKHLIIFLLFPLLAFTQETKFGVTQYIEAKDSISKMATIYWSLQNFEPKILGGAVNQYYNYQKQWVNLTMGTVTSITTGPGLIGGTITDNGILSLDTAGIALSKERAANTYQLKGNYMTAYTETDPLVSDWAKSGTKPSYTYSEVGAQPLTTNLTSIGGLTNASGWLKNNGTGTFSYSTPTYSDVGAAPSSTVTFPGFGSTGSTACVGNDARLSDSRPASDVSAWAKSGTKPSYTYSEVGAQPLTTNLTSIGGLTNASGWLKNNGTGTFSYSAPTYSDVGAAPSSTVTFPGFGSTGSTACVGNDARLSDSRPASDVSAWAKSGTKPSYTYSEVGAAPSSTVTFPGFGSTGSTACVGNDARLSDARTPSSHVHGNITNAGAIGTTATLPIITTTSGVLTAGSFGTSAGTFCQGNDSRLSDSRPASDVSAWAKSGTKPSYTYSEVGAAPSSTVTFPGFGSTGSTACVGNDARLSDSRTASDVSAWAKSGTKPSYNYSEVGAAPSSTVTFPGFGSTGSTACVGNDARLSDARTPSSHVHGNITNAGAIGTTATLPIITTTSGVLTAGSFGTSAGTFCQGNDSRLSDSRTASDVYTWAKAATKPTYTAGEVGAKATTEILVIFGGGVDSTLINTTMKFPIGYSPNDLTVDTLIFIATTVGAGTVNVTAKIFYGSDVEASGTAVVTAGNAITSHTTATKITAFNAAAIPRGRMVWMTFSDVTTKPRNFSVVVIGHRP